MKVWAWVVLVGVILTALSGAGYQIDQNGYQRALLELANSQKLADEAWRNILKQKQVKNDQLQMELLAEKNNIKTVEKRITKKVKIYVKNNSACNLSRGAVGLHNQAWGYSAAQGLPKNTYLPETKAQKTSTIRQQDLITKDIEYASWCEDLSVSFDKLVQAINENGY